MGNLLRFEFKRIRMNLFFWIITAYCIVWPIFVAGFYRLMFTLQIGNGGISFAELNMTADERKYVSWLILSAFFAEMPKFMALFTCLYIGKDSSDGFVRNKIIAGHSRFSIFMSNNIAQSLVTIFWCLIYSCFGALGLKIMGIGPDLNGGEMIRRIATAIAVLLVMSAVFTSLAMAFRNRALPVVLAILFTMIIGTVTTAVGMFNMPKAAADSYERCCAESIDQMAEQGAYTTGQADALKNITKSETIRGGKPWYIFHPVYQATNAGFQSDFNMPNAIGLTSDMTYHDEFSFADDMMMTALANNVLLDKETIRKQPGVTVSYGSKCLEYVIKSVIWYAVATAAGFILFKKKDIN